MLERSKEQKLNKSDTSSDHVHGGCLITNGEVNLKKSVAIKLTSISRGGSLETVPGGQSTVTQQQVPIVNIARYLGHVAGNYDTTSEAWRKAFAALATRLRLAMDKTNTVEQRARIAAAVIVPKLLYTARHAWPTSEQVSRADKRIRKFVWKADFTYREGRVGGWLPAEMVELPVPKGGGMPNFAAELTALAGSTVTNWVLSNDPLRLSAGASAFQGRSVSTVMVKRLSQRRSRPSQTVHDTLWETGRKLAE
jgi:hypothetical protein